jgi:hypothetical protein
MSGRYNIRETADRTQNGRSVRIHPDNSLITIDPGRVSGMLEVPSGQIEPYLEELIVTLIDECLSVVCPSACFSCFQRPEIDVSAGTMKLQGYTFYLNKMVASCLQKSEEIYCFIGTCGKEMENLSRKHRQQGNLLEGYIIDIIGSEMAESVAGIAHDTIEKYANRSGMKISNRYSPGYCRWPVSDQQKLFALMSGNTCGVKLTDSSLMLPIKSVSGIVGAGKEMKRMEYQCSKCDAKYCLFRDKYRNH